MIFYKLRKPPSLIAMNNQSDQIKYVTACMWTVN